MDGKKLRGWCPMRWTNQMDAEWSQEIFLLKCCIAITIAILSVKKETNNNKKNNTNKEQKFTTSSLRRKIPTMNP